MVIQEAPVKFSLIKKFQMAKASPFKLKKNTFSDPLNQITGEF
jgi:hypothetical protein